MDKDIKIRKGDASDTGSCLRGVMGTRIIRNRHLASVHIKQGVGGEYAVKRHSHEEVTIGVVDSGSSTITCKAQGFRMRFHDAVLFPPDAIHLCEPDKKGLFNFSVIHMEPNWFKDVFQLDPTHLNLQVRQLDRGLILEIQNFFSLFPQLNDPTEAESHAILLLGRVLFETFHMEFTSERIETLHDLQKVKEYIDANFIDPIKLDDLVSISGRSKYGLLRKFNAQYKATPHNYILNKRINHAKQLIRKGDSIAQIAVDCGFFDQSHFIKTFKKFVGVKPMDFR